MPITIPAGDYMLPAEAAESLRVSVGRIHILIQRGRFRAVTAPRVYLIPVEDVEHYRKERADRLAGRIGKSLDPKTDLN